MKELLLASVLALASFPGHAADQPADEPDASPEARITVGPPPYAGPPPIGWVYGNPNTVSCAPGSEGIYGICGSFVVNVPGAAGLNVRVTPNGPAIMALVNGTPIIPVKTEGKWTLIAAGCDLTPTFAWSWTAGVSLNRCWVYF